MFRTTKPRTRALLSIPVAFAAAAAISVPLVGVADAAHATNVLTITPTADSASVGTCNPYTIKLTNNGGTPLAGQVIDVEVFEDADAVTVGNQPTAGQDVDFCTAPTTNQQGQTLQPATPTNASVDPSPNNGTTTAGDMDRAEFTTNADGTVVIGIIGTEVGGARVLAYQEEPNAGNNQFDSVNGTEPSATATKTFTAGTASTSEGTANNATCVDATPENDTNVVGEAHSFTVVVTNGAEVAPGAGDLNNDTAGNPGSQCTGDTIAGVTPVFRVTGANPSATIVCTATDNSGRSTCTYTGTKAGNDVITVFVNKTAGGNANQADAGEPSDVIRKEYIAAALTGLQVDITCTAAPATVTPAGGTAPQDTQNNQPTAEDCINAINGAPNDFEDFVATVTGPDTAVDNDTLRDPIQNVVVRFTENGNDATIAPECTTDVNGQCTVRLTENTAVGGEIITVTATIVGQNPAGDPNDGEITVDSATKTFANQNVATARLLTLTPEFVNAQTNSVQTLTAKVVDASGNPVRGVPVTFTSTGVGRFLDNTTTKVVYTNAQGIATVQATTLVNETGTQTVTATIPGAGTTSCARLANQADNGTPQPGALAGDCEDVSVITWTTASPTAQPTGSPTATPTASATATATPTVSPTTAAPTTSPSGNLQCTNGTPAVVTLASNVTQITAGNSPTLTGTVQNTSNQPCASVAITIFKKGYGEASFTPLATVSTDANGKFTLVVRPLVQTAYGANTANNGVRSNIVVIRVYTRVNISSPAVPVPANSARPVSNPVTFTGTLLPGYSNVPVGLGTFINGRFVVLQQTRTTSTGAYSITRTLRPGTGVYVIFVSAHQGTDKGAKSITLNVS